MRKILSLTLLGLLLVTLAACGGKKTIIPDDILDCITDPNAEGCDDIIPDPTDNRSAEEILADSIIQNWDGDVTHLNNLLAAMDFTNSMEMDFPNN